MTEATYMHACTTVSQEVLTHLLLRLAHLLQAGRQSRAPECPLSRPNGTRVPMPPHMCTHVYTHTPLYYPWESTHILSLGELDSLPGKVFLVLLSLLSGL